MLPRLRIPALLYAALCLALWPSPLLGLLHVEAAALLATAGFFIAGFSAIGLFREGNGLQRTLVAHVGLLLIPWLLLTATLVWRANCGYALGCGLFLLFTVPSVLLAVALAYALTGTSVRLLRLWFGLLGLLMVTAPVAFDLLFHPQLYTYNHVFGGVLGPIYDEELAVRSGLFAFRGLTLLWAAWLIVLGRWFRIRNGVGEERLLLVRAGALIAAVIALVYAFAVPLGINTSAQQIARTLGAELDLGAFVIHYQPGSLTEAELAWIEDEHRYRYEQLREQLGVEVDEPIHVYLYPDPETRAALIGSRTTSVTPVWLSTPQIHMLAEHFSAEHFGHELAHVFAREFGMPVIRASTAVGLVEGLAVAVEPPDGLPQARYQVAATLEHAAGEFGRLDEGPAEAVVHAMNPFGFWSGRGAVSYATSGAFARFLLDQYGAENIRIAYRTGDFQEAYGESLGALAAAWEDEIRALEPDSEAVAIATWRFTQPSLFERHCPHHVPREVRFTRSAVDASERGDAAAALRFYLAALDQDATYAPALAGWTRVLIGTGSEVSEALPRLEASVFEQDGSIADAVDVRLIGALADGYKSLSDSAAAGAMYAEAFRRLPPYARQAKAGIILRSGLSARGLRAVFSPGNAGAWAVRLETLAAAEPALWFFAAAYRSVAGDASSALEAIRQLPSFDSQIGSVDAGQQQMVERARLALLAHYAGRARDYSASLHYAEVAAAAYRQERASGPALLMDDLAAKARWFLGVGRI